MQNDPYSFAATRLLTAKAQAISDFWTHFAKHADQLDVFFTQAPGADQVDVGAIMAKLRDVSEELMWEFGPAETGHTLCITAEWKHHMRPLARACIDLAPQLPGWAFFDARTGLDPAGFAENFSARFGVDCTISQIDLAVGADNKIDMTVSGQGTDDDLCNQALLAAGLLLGEQIDRDWFGTVSPKTSTAKRLFSRLKSAPAFDATRFVDAFHAKINEARAGLPILALAHTDIETRQATLLDFAGVAGQTNRPDMITFAVPNQSYAEAVLRPGLFASANHSAHGEWFLCLRIPHDGQGNVDLRVTLEDRLHSTFAAASIGGLVAAGHGTEAYYIDIGTTDIDRAVSIFTVDFADVLHPGSTLHFLDAGLDECVVPLANPSHRPQ